MFLLSTLLVVAAYPSHVAAASYTWDGGGTTDNWSDCANWSSDICPVAADAVTFNATSTKNSIVDAGWTGTVTSLTIAAGYNGTVTLDRSLSVSGTFSQVTGVFNAGINTLTIGTFSLPGGIFTASSNNLTVSSVFSISGGTFNHNNGTVIIAGAGNTITCNNAVFNLVVFQNTGTKTISAGCTLPLGDNPTLSTSGALTLNGNLTGTGNFTKTSSIINLNATGAITGFSSLSVNALTINGPAVDWTNLSELIVNGAFILANGSIVTPSSADFNGGFTLQSGSAFTAPSNTATFAGAFTINSGATFNANGGTVIFDGVTSAAITCNNATFNLVGIAHTNQVKTINDGCVFPLGHDATVNGSVIVNGVLTGTGTLSRPVGTTTINATGNITGFSSLNGGALVINDAALDWEHYDSVIVTSFTATNTTLNWGAVSSLAANGAMTLNGVTFIAPVSTDINGNLIMNTGTVFTAPSDTMYLAGNFTLNAGATFNHNSGTLYLDGAAGVFECNNTTFNLVVIDKRSLGNGTVNASCSFPLGHDPVVFVNSSSSGWNVNGTFTGSGTLNLQGVAVSFNAPGGISGFSGIIGRLVFFGGGNVDLSSFSPATFVTLRLRDNVNFTAPAGELRTSSFYVSPGTTFDANGGTMVLQGNDGSSATWTWDCNNVVFNSVRLEQINRTDILSNCTLPLGHDPVISGPDIRAKDIGRQGFRLSGTLTGSGTITVYGVFQFNDGYQLSGFSDIITDNLTVSNATADFSSLDTITVLMNVAVTGNVTLPNLLSIGGNVSLAASSILNPDSGTVSLTGTNQSLAGDITFHNLTKTNSGSLSFAPEKTVTITNELSFTGTEGNLLSLLSTVPGQAWFIETANHNTLQYLYVQDSHNTGAQPMVAENSTDGGNNINWVLGAQPDTPSDDIGTPGSLAATGMSILPPVILSLILFIIACALIPRKRVYRAR